MTASPPQGADESPSPPDDSGEDFPIVAIGASAGGLEACKTLFDNFAPDTGMAFIVVQHMGPTQHSMLVDLLGGHTAMVVSQAEDGTRLAPDHVYVIAPGTYLSVRGGALVVSRPDAPRLARLPFDHLLNSMGPDLGARAVCVILSGALGDGSHGLEAVKAHGGMVIVQDPDEAGFDGMPRGAIRTGGVDLVLPVAEIPAGIARLLRRGSPKGARRPSLPTTPMSGPLADIIQLILDQTGHDFRLYKPGTLQRRIRRRMALAGLQTDAMDRYAARLRDDPIELDILAKELLIHVTSFFRDPEVFAVLAETVAPGIIRDRMIDDPIRLWVAGCSTGEEAYSLAMIFKEQLSATGRDIKLQVFASDVDPEAVTAARDGFYPRAIAEVVSPARLARFFVTEEHGYRISPELRGCVVFTVQNLLSDPPFSRLDLISCRNLLIYLRPEAQSRAVAIFHFALKPGGILLLGASESAGRADGRFAVVAKSARIYRQIGRGRPGDFSFPMGPGVFARRAPRVGPAAVANAGSLADLCRRLVLETHAPAAVLVNRSRECLYSLGPTDRYLRVAPGAPNVDILAMARPGLRAKLASVISQGFSQNDRVVARGGPVTWDGRVHAFDIEARPVQVGGETLLLLCFLDTAKSPARLGSPEDASRVSELEAELEATRAELQSAIRGIEIATEEQTTINEEALSVNEEYQSTNEELITSKEELQSLNEELTALNNQLQETLDLQRTSANDLQNILYSTEVATIFLDADLCIRFFTPVTRALFKVIPGDVGRPLADLKSMAADDDILDDAAAMLRGAAPIAKEIMSNDGLWYLRRVMPYRAKGDTVEGVVITYTDVTERKETAKSLEAATLAADAANRAKSRFLAAASHDLRQPLQTLTLIHGLLARKDLGEAERKLIALQEQCLTAMSGMLNTLLDINQIDAGIIQGEKQDFRVDGLLDRLREEFAYHAQAKGLRLRVTRCSAMITSDPALLEQMIRNLIGNAMKYTRRGKVLVGCRRAGDHLKIQVLDTGIGIQPGELDSIFEEYHQVENVARERRRGLGLGLSIVKRLGALLGHEVGVASRAGRGSVFTIVVDLAPPARTAPSWTAPESPPPAVDSPPPAVKPGPPPRRYGAVLIVEDDPEVRSLLELVIEEDGCRPMTAEDGHAALDLVAASAIRPDVVLVDYNLPGGMTGLDLAARLRGRLGPDSPVVVLTGDISAETLRAIAERDCIPLHKPVKPEVLTRVIQSLLPAEALTGQGAQSTPPSPGGGRPMIYIVDDDDDVRRAIELVLRAEGFAARSFADCEAFLADYQPGGGVCLLIDAYLPGGMSGLDLLAHLREAGDLLPAIMITGEADVRIAVQAMKAGAADFFEKPITGPALIKSIRKVLENAQDSGKLAEARAGAAELMANLTSRQREIMERVLAGHPSKNIAADLGISQRTVENHRAAIMRRTGVKSLPALARLAIAAGDT